MDLIARRCVVAHNPISNLRSAAVSCSSEAALAWDFLCVSAATRPITDVR